MGKGSKAGLKWDYTGGNGLPLKSGEMGTHGSWKRGRTFRNRDVDRGHKRGLQGFPLWARIFMLF